MRKVLRFLGALFASLLILAVVGAGGALYLLHRYGSDLPDYRQLADYQPPTVTRIHAADGRLMAEYAQEKRIFVPVEAIPKRLIQAFLAAEDKNFYSHPGIDPLGIIRAALTNLWHFGQNRRPVGASTITQQVAKNFLLTGEVSLSRKIKEALLAFRIERAFTKDQILELYLNEIYLGARLLWRGGGGAQLFRQIAGRADHRRGRVPGRSAQGAVLVQSGPAAGGGQGAARLGDRADARISGSSTTPTPSTPWPSRW